MCCITIVHYPVLKSQGVSDSLFTITKYIVASHHDDAIKWKHFPRYLPLVRGIHRGVKIWNYICNVVYYDCSLSCFKISRSVWFIVHHITKYIVASNHDDAIKWKHFPRYLPLVRGIHRGVKIWNYICNVVYYDCSLSCFKISRSVWFIVHHITKYIVASHHDDAIKWKQFPRYLPLVRGIHRGVKIWNYICNVVYYDCSLSCFNISRSVWFIVHHITKYIVASHHDDAIEWKHFPRYLPLVRGIHQSPVNSPYKGQWAGALMSSLIGTWTNGWVSTRDAGDLRHRRAHYGVTVI